MTQAMGAWVTASERALRVALTRDGRIESERLVRAKVSVGSREKCDFVVRDDRFEGALFVERDGTWLLRLPAGVTGKLADTSGVRRLTASKTDREIPLGPDARGRLETVDGALLFQLVVPPPTMPRAQLPASVRGGLFGQVDWHFTSITIAVFMLFFGATVMMEAADWPMAVSPMDDPGLRAIITFVEEDPPPDPAATWAQTDPVEPEIETPAPEVADNTPAPSTNRPERTNRSQADSTPSLQDLEDIRQGITLDLGTLAAGESPFADLVRDGAPTTDHAELFADIDAVQHASISAMHGPRDTHRCSGNCDEQPGSIRQIARTGPVNTMGPTEREPLGGVTLRPFDPIDPGETFDPAALVRRIRGKSRLIARCYETELTRHGELRGRIDVEVTIMPAGIVRANVTRDTMGSANVSGCVERHLESIRLRRGPTDGPAILGFPFVFQPQR